MPPALSSSTGTQPFSTVRPARLALAGVLLVLIALRLFNLLQLPMFHDEALHIGRAERVLTDGTLLVGTEGGKYLQLWLLAPLLPLFDNPLLASRLLAAVVGLLGSVGCYLLARYLYQRDAVALVAAALYATAPYVLFFDRLGLADGLLSTLAIWSLLLSVVTVRQGRWWQTLSLGLCLGLAVATKLNGILFLLFPLAAAWLQRGNRPWSRVLPGILVAWCLALPWLLPSLLNLIPQYKSTIARSWADSQVEGISHLTRLGQNLGIMVTTLWTYLTPPLFLLALIEMGPFLRRRDRASWLLALSALVTLVFFLLTAASHKFYPRYLLPAFPFLLILAARALVALTRWLQRQVPRLRSVPHGALLALLTILVSLPAVHFDTILLTDPPRAAWLPIDRWQYIDGWPAGYGLIDAAGDLRQRAEELGTIVVVKRATSQMRAGAWMYYLDQPNILLQAINLKHADPQSLIQDLEQSPFPIFVVLDLPSEDRYVTDFTQGPYAPYSTLIATHPRPGGTSRIEIYRMTSTP